jgi:hypothetical protein
MDWIIDEILTFELLLLPQNCQNKRFSSRNKSGYRGVHWDSNRQKWIAQIKVNNKIHFLGRYDDIEKAAKVYYETRKKLMPYSSPEEFPKMG